MKNNAFHAVAALALVGILIASPKEKKNTDSVLSRLAEAEVNKHAEAAQVQNEQQPPQCTRKVVLS